MGLGRRRPVGTPRLSQRRVEFTVASIGRYLIHDPVHHVDDVNRGNAILADGQLD